jgi:hypothetical protein
VRYGILLGIFLGSAILYGQKNFFIHNKIVFVDSVFLKGAYAARYYHNSIDSLVLKTNNQEEKAALIYIKALKLTEEGKLAESVGILKFALQHLDSLSNLAKARLHFRIGINLSFMDKTLEGLQYLSKADSIALKYGNPDLILRVKGGYAEINRNIGRLDRSLEIIQSGLPYVHKTTNGNQLEFLLGYITTCNQLSVRDQDPALAFKANSITDSLLNNIRVFDDLSVYAYLLAEKGSSLSILK